MNSVRLYAIVIALSFASSLAGVLLGQVPVRNGADEFAYLLGGQTFAAGRLTNPSHAHWQFFETFHVLTRPSYMAKYPPAQSFVLAVGYKLGAPIFGVWLASAGFAAAATWLLRARLAPRWALLGGILTVVQFGTTHYYTQSYWGGAVAAAGGALIIGATLRLWRAVAVRDAALLGAGVAIGLLSRPFETVLLCIVPATLCLNRLIAKTRGRARFGRNIFLVTAPLVLAAVLFQARLNHAVTGDWRRLPYTEYEAQYSGAPLFAWQEPRPAPPFQNEVLALFHSNFLMPSSRFESPVPLVWLRRVCALFIASAGPLLAIAGVAGTLRWPTRPILLVWSIIGVSSIGMVLSHWFFPHYYAGLHAACVFIGVYGLRAAYLATHRWQPRFPLVAIVTLMACAGARVAANENVRPLLTTLAHARQSIETQLHADGQRHLVFVRRLRPFNFHFTWVYNDADLDGSRIVWAHDRGPEENRKLLEYYGASRRTWLLVERNDEPRLIPWP